MLKRVIIGLIVISTISISSFAAENTSDPVKWEELIIKVLIAPIIAFLIPIMWKLSAIPINKYEKIQ